MYLWESDIQKSVVFKPIEIRGKKGRKKTKKSNAIYIPNMDADNFEKICNEKGLQFVYVEVPPHGRLIDADKLKADNPIHMGADVPYVTEVTVEEIIDAAPTIIPAESEGET